MMDHQPANAQNPSGQPSAALALRALQSGDIPAYGALLQRIFAQPPWNEAWTLNEISRGLISVMAKPGFVGIAAEYQNQPIGFLTGYRLGFPPITPACFFLDQLFVDEGHRRTGTGKALLLRALGLAATCKYWGMLLLTKTNTPAEQFYRENGFGRFLSFIRIKGKHLLYRSLI